MSWKTAVFDYVRAKNRAETEHDIEPMRGVLTDPIGLTELARFLRGAKQSATERGLKPIEQQTKLQMLTASESLSGAVVDLELRRSFAYELRGVSHTEERVERERVTVTSGNDGWTVSKVERLQPPDGHTGPLPGATMLHYASEQPQMDGNGGSAPYLNNSFLHPHEISPRRYQYHREAAVQYAETWWNGANPRYIEFPVDCTNFVSQCLYAGGLPMNYTGRRDAGWWYRGKAQGHELWSYSWAVANSFMRFLLGSGRARQAGSPLELRLGDIICYDWNGTGHYQHNTIITSHDAAGMPLVNAHTYNARSRYWAYEDSPAWTQRTRYTFLRIADQI